MSRRIGAPRGAVGLALALLTAVVLAACGTSGSGASGAQNLLKQTFSGPHSVKSGVLSFRLRLTPSGSSTLTTPITLGLSGPFQSRGAGKLPASDLTLNLDALGHHGQLGIISTGTHGYITLAGAAYQLPAADYQKLAASFAGAAGGSATGGLSTLGIDPQHWLQNPSIIGTETVAGAATTHIRAQVNVASLLSDLNTLLHKASASGATATSKIPTTISPATRQKIASEVKHPVVDIWTGSSDETLRKLSVSLNLPVSGQLSALFGGLSSAGIGFTLQYADLNQPQTIAAPTNVQPFSGFAIKLQSILAHVQGTLGAGQTTGSASGSSSGAGSSSSVNGYASCIQQASGDVTKMQKCASLLSGG